MTKDYNGVKFYDENDLSNGLQLRRAEKVIKAFSEKQAVTSINEAIELYNIHQLINAGIYLKKWDEITISALKASVQSYIGICARFFASITDDNLSLNYEQLWFLYIDDFWKLFDRFKLYKRISATTVIKLFHDDSESIIPLLMNKNTVIAYDTSIAEYLRNSYSAVPIIVHNFLEDKKDKQYLPNSLSSAEYDGLFQKYITWEDANLNCLQILSMAQSSGECPISDKTKLAARKAYEKVWSERKENGTQFSYGVGVSFKDIPQIVQEEREKNNFLFTYDLKWFEDNLDYSTVLNNFIYVFRQIDLCWRSSLPSLSSEMGALEAAFTHNEKNGYRCGYHYRTKHMLYSLQIQCYYDFLKSHDIQFEEILEWFFAEYLSSEFGVTGFVFNAPTSGTTWLEKCRTIASEMDGILKQYRMFREDDVIDRELLEISSGQINVSTLLSFTNDKYAYPDSTEISREINLLFSDQSCLSYTDRTKSNYSTLYELLSSVRDLKLIDFVQVQEPDLTWLQMRRTIYTDKSGYLCLNEERCSLLKDLYEHDVLCPRYYGRRRNLVDELVQTGDLRVSNTLFSEPEQEYYNFILNKSRFSNGLDLRNKYVHGTYTMDEQTQKDDYFELLKLMIMVIAKINEECIIREEMRQNQ